MVANVEVAWRILGPEKALRPAFVSVPLDIRSPLGVAALATIVTLTPGTLSADLDERGEHLLVHALHLPDGDRTYRLSVERHLGDSRISGTVDGRPFTAQMERGRTANPLAIRVIHNGTRLDTLVLTPRSAALHALMPFKAPPDMSRFLLSPMPGLLVDVAVTPGQKVQAGERLAVIEAMKMENVLFAAADGVVGKVLAAKGESLAVDQPIIEFA